MSYQMESEAIYLCRSCGKQLSEENAYYRASGVSAYCIDCENKRFTSVEKANGTHIALFACCMAFNVPLEPEIVPDNWQDQSKKWEEYQERLIEKRLDEKNGYIRGFTDGVCDIRRIFGRGMTETDFARYIEAEQMSQKRKGKEEGTEAQRERWGIIWDTDNNITTAQYDELDRLYNNRLQSYKGQTITPQMEDTLQRVCMWTVRVNELVSQGAYKQAKDLSFMIEQSLASENMRKKDEKPVENFRIDAQIKALEEAGIIEDGHFVSFKELVAVLSKNCIRRKKYDYSLDAADQMIMDYYNTMRKNSDLPILQELPDELELEDDFDEFEEEETEEEKKRKRYANLLPVHFESEYAEKGAEKKEEKESDSKYSSLAEYLREEGKKKGKSKNKDNKGGNK